MQLLVAKFYAPATSLGTCNREIRQNQHSYIHRCYRMEYRHFGVEWNGILSFKKSSGSSDFATQ